MAEIEFASEHVPMSNGSGIEIADNTAQNRYELSVDGELAGYARYSAENDRMVLLETWIDPARRGEGLGQDLANAVLEDIGSRGSLIEPRCEFIAEHIREHPGFHQLVTPGARERLAKAA